MGVFKRTRKKVGGSEVEFYYIRYALNGKMKWESVGEVGKVTKTMARAFWRKERNRLV